jgi:hypothetical protein
MTTQEPTQVAIRTTAQDEESEEEPWCDHQDLPTATPCHKPGIPVGAEGPDGRTPYVCTAGHHFLWPGLGRPGNTGDADA